MIYPWQKESWQKLVQYWQNKPNAWLFYGSQHIGKLSFAMEYAKAVLCEQPLIGSYLPCEQCQACHLFSQNSHPDFYHVSGQNDSEAVRSSQLIKIEQIRQISETIQSSSYFGGWKVVLIEPAEMMNASAANALLKVLEEPPSETIFLLVSHAKDSLLPTIISRCRQFFLPVPSQEQSLEYLATLPDFDENIRFSVAFNGGRPFMEKNFPLGVYQKFQEIMLQPRLLLCLDFAKYYESEIKSLNYFFDWFYKWLVDIILSKQGYQIKFNGPISKKIEKEVKDRYTFDDLFALLKLVKGQARLSGSPLNIKLQIENVILEYLLLSIR